MVGFKVPFRTQTRLNNEFRKDLVTPRNVYATIHITKVLLSIITHAAGKAVEVYGSDGTVYVRHVDAAAGAGVLSRVCWDFGTHGIPLETGKTLRCVGQSGGVAGIVVVEGYQVVSVTHTTSTTINPDVLFREPGTDDTADFSNFFDHQDGVSGSTGVMTSATDQFVSSARSIKFVGAAPNDQAYAETADGGVEPTGTRLSFTLRWDDVSLTDRTGVLQVNRPHATGNTVFGVCFETSNKMSITARDGVAGLTAIGTTVLAADTWYRISVSWVITSATSYTFKLYVNGVLEATLTQADGTLQYTDVSVAAFGSTINGAVALPALPVQTYWLDNIYIDNGSDLTDVGNQF